ncbi:hypothetical protein V8G54_009401 [Vigna mungo]|uniref:Uncharacterized protein n=1 Tax=Vigna mungo TaxID=3915 RepID=A0AAQ3S238_VIGMU
MEVGFLGLGIMGKAMATNLLRHGFKVTVWNRTLSKCEELVQHGASVGETPATVVKKCKYTIAMLSDPSAALSVVFDKDGVLDHINGKGYVDMSTVDADTSSKISEAIKAKGGYFLEAPVSGSKKPAEDGQLVILAAGDKPFSSYTVKSSFVGNKGATTAESVVATRTDEVRDVNLRISQNWAKRIQEEWKSLEEDLSYRPPPKPPDLKLQKVAVVLDVVDSFDMQALYDEALPAFDILGKKSFFLGDVGNGAKMKLVVNMIMGSMMNAFSEGLTLAERSGLNPATLLDVLDLGAISNGMFKLKGPTMLQNSYSPAFPLKHQQKDMRLALALGDENAVSMPIAAAANEAFKKARSLGLGDLDFSAVHETYKAPDRSS